MAIVQSPFLGKIRGKFAGAIFYILYGKIIMRSKPLTVKDAKTPGQLKQRKNFSVMVNLYKSIKAFASRGFPEFRLHMSQYNAFMKSNIKTAIKGTYPDISVDFPKLVVSGGSLANAEGAIVSGKGNTINIDWNDNSGVGNARATDIAMALLINPTDRNVEMDIKTRTRAEKSLQMKVPSSWEGDLVYAYLSFRTALGDMTANSRFLGSFKITGKGDPDNENGNNILSQQESIAGDDITSHVFLNKPRSDRYAANVSSSYQTNNTTKICYIYKEQNNYNTFENSAGAKGTTEQYVYYTIDNTFSTNFSGEVRNTETAIPMVQGDNKTEEIYPEINKEKQQDSHTQLEFKEKPNNYGDLKTSTQDPRTDSLIPLQFYSQNTSALYKYFNDANISRTLKSDVPTLYFRNQTKTLAMGWSSIRQEEIRVGTKNKFDSTM